MIEWHELKRPFTWRPRTGDVLEGRYLGRTLRNGHWGQYEVIIIQAPDILYTVSGTTLISMLDTSKVPEGALLKIVYDGPQTYGTDGKWYKKFSMFVGEERE